VGFITRPMPARIQQNKLVVMLECVNVPKLPPALQVAREPMLEHQWRTFAFNLIMDTDSLIVGIWHTISSYGTALRHLREKG